MKDGEILGKGLLGGSNGCFPEYIKFLMFADPLEFAIAKALTVPVKELDEENKSGFLMVIWWNFLMFYHLSNTSTQRPQRKQYR